MPNRVAAGCRPSVGAKEDTLDEGRVVGGEKDRVVRPDMASKIGIAVACAVDDAVVNDFHVVNDDVCSIGDAVNQRVVLPNLAYPIIVAREIDILGMGQADEEKQSSEECGYFFHGMWLSKNVIF